MSPELLKEHTTASGHRAKRVPNLDDNRVLSFSQWCELNGFSRATGQRVMRSGSGPTITQLSDRRIGITIANNAAWQASRAR
jgi:hypothetical protein